MATTEARMKQLTGAYADLNKSNMLVGEMAVPSDHVPIVRNGVNNWEDLLTSQSAGDIIALSETMTEQIDSFEQLVIDKVGINDGTATLTQAYSGSKTQGLIDGVNTNLGTKASQSSLDATNAEVNTKAEQADLNSTNAIVAQKADKSEVTNAMIPKGNIAYNSLPMTGNTIGWYYYCADGDGTHGAGNYVWNGTTWYFGGTGDEGYNIVSEEIKSITTKLINTIPINSKILGYYYNNGSGGTTSSATTDIFDDPIPIVAGTQYYYNNLYAYFTWIRYADGTKIRLSSNTSSSLSGSFVATQNGSIIVTVSKSVDFCCFSDNQITYNYKSYVPVYIPNKLKIANPNIITVKKVGGDFDTLIEAVKSIGYTDENNKVEIRIYSGTYDILEELGGNAFLSSIVNTSNNRLGITLPNWVSLVGVGDVTLELLPDDSASNINTTTCISVLEVYGNTKIENINIVAKNCRYCVHDETANSATYAMSEHKYKNCHFKHLGNVDGLWVSTASIAHGTSSGCKYIYENSIFESAEFYAWSMHNNENQEANNVIFDGCLFISGLESYSVKFGYYKLNDNQSNVFIKNCKSDNKTILVRPESDSVPSTNVWNILNFTDIAVEVR